MSTNDYLMHHLFHIICCILMYRYYVFQYTYNLFFIFLDLEWKMIYVGSAESEEHDQILDTIYVGPVPEGRHMFVFEVFI